MNETYIPIGKEGKARNKSLARQDKNALGLGPAVAATRAMTKASPFYAPEWDLVNSVDADRVDLAVIEDHQLPRSMRGMTTEERLLFVNDTREIRAELRRRIAELSVDRRRAVSDRMAAFGAEDARSFDQVVRRTIREKARKRGFHFPED